MTLGEEDLLFSSGLVYFAVVGGWWLVVAAGVVVVVVGGGGNPHVVDVGRGWGLWGGRDAFVVVFVSN